MSDIEREEFEQAVADKWSDSYSFTRFGDEDYYDEVLEGMWVGWQASRQALEGEAIGEVGYMFQPNWDDPSKTKSVALVDKSLAPGTKLYTHPASAEVERLQARVAELYDLIKYAQVDSGVCMCGDDIKDHNQYSGHSPVDVWDHAVEHIIKKAGDNNV